MGAAGSGASRAGKGKGKNGSVDISGFDQRLRYADHAKIVRPSGQGWRVVKKPLTRADVEQHYTNGTKFGVPFVRPGGHECVAAMLDLDDHNGKAGWDEVCHVARLLLGEMEEAGLYVYPYRSGGGQGINLWMVWDTPQDAHSVRVLLADVVQRCGLAVGAGGVEKGEVELFPKQAWLDADETGNCAALPLTAIDPLFFEELGAGEYHRWAASVDVPVVEHGGQEGFGDGDVGCGGDASDDASGDAGVAERVRLEPWQIDQLLEYIDPGNEEDGDALDYDEWWRVITAIKAAGGTLEQAEAWSAQSDKHVEGYLGRKWKSLRRDEKVGPGGGNVLGVGSLIWLAREGGWDGFEGEVSAFPGLDGDGLGVVDGGTGAVVGDGAGGDLDQCGPGPDGADSGDSGELDYERGSGGKVISSALSVSVCCLRDAAWPYRYSRDRFLSQVLVNGSPYVDEHLIEARCWFDLHGWTAVGKDLMRDVVNAVAAREDRVEDCALKWVSGLEWDGVDRFGELVDRMGVERGDRRFGLAVVRYMFSAMVGRQYSPGCQLDMVPVLVGEQGVRKSSLIEAMVPVLGGGVTEGHLTFGEGTLGDLIDGDRAARLMKGKLIVVLDELQGMKRERETIKNALVRRFEEYTPKYKETREIYPRRCLIMGTTNEEDFLDDPTGSRRWLPLRVGVGRDIDVEWVASNMVGLWAQGKHLWLGSGIAWQDAQRLAVHEHGKYENNDPWESPTENYLSTSPEDHFTVRDILVNAIGKKNADLKRADEMRVSGILKRLGYKKQRTMVDGVKKMLWLKG